MQTELRNRVVWSNAPENRSYANAYANANAKSSEPQAPNDGEQGAQFILMLQSFRLSGGLCRAHWVVDLLLSRHAGDAGTLARWIVSGQVLHFEWQHATWLPMFQFDPAALTPRAGIAGVLQELTGVFNNWEIAAWFSSPASNLQGQTPAVAFATSPEAVLQAARCDRYLVDG